MIEKKVVTGTLTKAPMIPIDFLLILNMRNVGLYFPLMEHGKKLNLSPGNLKKNDKNLFAAKHVISLQHVPTPFMCLFSLEKCLFGFHFLENPGGNGSNENTVSSCPATIPHFLGGKMHKLDKGQNEQEPKTVGISSLYQSPQTLFHQSRPVSPGMGSALELVSRAPSSYVC